LQSEIHNPQSKCPRQELNLVFDLRRVACESGTLRGRTAAEIAARDDERQTKRVEARTKIAAAQLAERRLNEINDAIAMTNEKKEAMASAHIDRCTPIQTQLVEIERAQIASITSRESSDESLEDRRRKLLIRLRELNTDLEEKIGREDRLLSALEADRVSAARACGNSVLMNQLAELASPESRIKMRSTATVHQKLEHWRDALRKDLTNYPREAARLGAELSLVESMVEKAAADANEAYRVCVEE
jgi:hypothetical protein